MAYEYILTERFDGVAVITLNRPDKLNALSFPLVRELDETKGEALKAGGFLHMPKGMPHYAWFTEETIIQSNGVGKTGITYVNPADDLRKTN